MQRCVVQFVGHATAVIDLDGVRVVTDPLLRPRITGLVHLHPPRDLRMVHGVQVALISHLHHDHLDIPSLGRLPRAALLIAPPGAARMLGRRGFRNTLILRVGETYQVGRVRVTATPARHFGYRFPFGPLGGCLGYVLEGSRRVYFAGDTDVFSDMDRLGAIDLALLPVGGWGPILGPGHMGPLEAVRALQLLRPRMAIPIHWGSLVPVGVHVRAWPCLTRPPREFAALARRLAPDVKVRVLAPGASLEF